MPSLYSVTLQCMNFYHNMGTPCSTNRIRYSSTYTVIWSRPELTVFFFFFFSLAQADEHSSPESTMSRPSSISSLAYVHFFLTTGESSKPRPYTMYESLPANPVYECLDLHLSCEWLNLHPAILHMYTVTRSLLAQSSLCLFLLSCFPSLIH